MIASTGWAHMSLNILIQWWKSWINLRKWWSVSEEEKHEATRTIKAWWTVCQKELTQCRCNRARLVAYWTRRQPRQSWYEWKNWSFIVRKPQRYSAWCYRWQSDQRSYSCSEGIEKFLISIEELWTVEAIVVITKMSLRIMEQQELMKEKMDDKMIRYHWCNRDCPCNVLLLRRRDNPQSDMKPRDLTPEKEYRNGESTTIMHFYENYWVKKIWWYQIMWVAKGRHEFFKRNVFEAILYRWDGKQTISGKFLSLIYFEKKNRCWMSYILKVVACEATPMTKN